jgi:hypothetical protein
MIFLKCDDTIRGHVFCSFLAPALMKELFSRLQQSRDRYYEWNDIKRGLEALWEVELQTVQSVVRLAVLENAEKFVSLILSIHKKYFCETQVFHI